MTPYYDDGTCVIYHGDATDLPLVAQSVSVVVTSPPYNVGVDYDGHDDSMPWPDYWRMVGEACVEMYRALCATGRAWVNVAPPFPVELSARAIRLFAQDVLDFGGVA